jgi:hypothetical protein
MAKVQLAIPESQVVALVQQLSPQAKQVVWQMLISESVEVDDVEAFLEEEEELAALWDEDEELAALWDEDEAFWDDDYPAMGPRELLAAETFSYSYANYDDHLGIGNVRFDTLMPDNVDTLEQAEQEGWDDARLAHALDVEVDKVGFWRESYRRAKEIVEAPTPAESYRRGVRYSIQDAVEEGLTGEEAIEGLVTQICYRAADLAYLLDMEAETLSRYSRELRKSSAADLEALDEELNDL